MAYDGANRRIIHNYILAEFVTLAHSRGLPRVDSLAFLANLDDPEVETIWVDESLRREAMALLSARRDKAYSLCDAVSFLIMRRRGLVEALSTDRHFEQEGFRRLLS